MDNTNYTRRPRKRVTKKMAQRRRFTALAVVILLLILSIILIGNACGDDKGKGKTPDKPQTTTTTAVTATEPTVTTTVPVPTTPPVTADPNDPNTITGISLDKYAVFVEVGQKDMPWVTMTPSSSTEKGEIWTSSDETIATVDHIGNITGVSAGECVVTVTSKNNPLIYAEVKVTVTDPNQEPANAVGQSNTSTDVQSSPLVNNETTTEPKDNNTSSPEGLEVINGRTYVDGILIANKSYALPSDYAPGLDPETESQFNKLSDDAAKVGLNIYLSSGYRSYSYQSQIYSNYSSIYGADTADTFSARPGHSEHQTGLAIDVNTIDDSFAGTPEAEWLAENAHRYGFIIRYPKDKVAITGYKYEPWHLRYLGTDTATKVYNSGLCLEEYLGIDSVYR